MTTPAVGLLDHTAGPGLRAALERHRAVVAVLPVVDEKLTVAALLPRLSAAERERAGRFRFRRDRVLYVAAHRLLAALVEMALAPDRPAWALTAPDRGEKPRLAIEGAAGLFANLSHTAGFAAVGLSRTAELGVDVEAVRPVDDLAEFAASTMTPREQAAIGAATIPEAMFFRLWTRKEALLKAYGVGLGTALTAIDVLDPQALRVPVALHGPLTLVDLELGSGVMGNVCVLEQPSDVALITFTAEWLFDRASDPAGTGRRSSAPPER